MEKYDVIIAGASTTGSWFAVEMAKRGFSVLLLEKSSREEISKDFDIFHMGYDEMVKFGYPIPEPGDKDYAFEFYGGAAYSAFGHYPKHTHARVIGMHKHDYILRLNDLAVSLGVELLYNASFSGFLFDEDGRISGVSYSRDGKEYRAFASVVADCTGIPSVARRALPDGYGVENFPITPRDMFYVILYYVKYPDSFDKVIHTDSFLQYKCWSAPGNGEHGGILGVGANLSFDYAEEMFREFRKNVPLPPYEVEKVERGATPYKRSPYSFVADGFIAMGDAACTTKPNNGEGCTSALYLSREAVEVVSRELKEGGYLTKERLWSINKKYNDSQGKSFAMMRTAFIGAASLNKEENEFLFAHDIGFSEKVFNGLSGGLNISLADAAAMAGKLAVGIALGKLRLSFTKKLLQAGLNAIEMMKLYGDFPETPDGFEAWCEKADELWSKVGEMADNCDPEIIERAERRRSADKTQTDSVLS